MVQKRIILANDLSGIGKVALTPAIPIMACCQIETILLPTILLSSHITSDLEKIADYIVFIHDGEIILNKTKDELIYEYGVIRCSENDFVSIATEDILSYMKKDYQIDVLVSDRKLMKKKYKNLIVDNMSLDEMMLLMVRGEGNERLA